MKVILHLDMDSYFVAAARTIDHALEGRPVVISNGGERAIISAASYEAKVRGIKVPMPLYQARRLVPEVVVVKPDFGLYTYLAAKVFEFLFQTYTTQIETASIDECYIDATTIWSRFSTPVALARHIQAAIKREFGLPCSIGIGANKFVAKMSTPLNKPLGITVTKPGDFLQRFGTMDLIHYYGIGPATKHKLQAAGYTTIAHLAQANLVSIQAIVGNTAERLISQANGLGVDELDLKHNALQGISNEITFQHGDRVERQELLDTLAVLGEMVAQRMKNRRLAGQVIAVYYKLSGGRESRKLMRQKTLLQPIWHYSDIMAVARQLFDEIWTEKSLKFIGIRVTKLIDMRHFTYQASIFNANPESNEIKALIQKVNGHLQSNVIGTAQEYIESETAQRQQQRFIESDRIIKHFDVKKDDKLVT